MSLAEVLHRLRYAAELAAEREQHKRGTLSPKDRLARAVRRDLQGPEWRRRLLDARCHTPARFFDSVRSGEQIRRLFDRHFASERLAAAAQADRLRAGHFEFFGRRYHYPDSLKWQSDPVTGSDWPALFHADVPVHRGDIGCGDVKDVWEFSRQQYVIDLAKAHYLLGREDDLAAVHRLVTSWIAGNPYATGVNWACALEPAFRAWSWLWAYHLTSHAIQDDFHCEWLCGFYDHARFLYKHLEHYSSPYNHLIGEASALFALGLLFPEFAEAARWRDRGYRVLKERLHQQFYPDGGSVEQSTFYHHATLGFYLLAALLGRANGHELPVDVWRAIERALDFSAALMQPNGRIPEIGGADDGKPIRLEHLPFWDFRPYLAMGAVLFNRGDFKALAGRFSEDALWLLGPRGFDDFASLAARPPQSTAAVLRSSGYVVSRRDWSSTADYVCFDVGEQAAGIRADAVPNSMHGHADCLSVIAWLQGRRVLVDSGLFAYNCGGPWEAHFRETAAHNTARIDGRDQARHLGKMAWSHGYHATLEDVFTDKSQAWVIGSHDGYARGPEGVTHRRAIWLRPGGYLLICDRFDGRGRHDIELNYQFAPGTFELSDGAAVFDGAVDIAWFSATAWAPSFRCGGPEPHHGWICPSLHVRVPAPRLTLQVTATDLPTSVLTVFATRLAAHSRIVAAPRSASLAGVRVGDAIDWIEITGHFTGPIRSDGMIAICTVGEGEIVERSHAGGSYVDVDDDALRDMHCRWQRSVPR